MVVTAGVAVLLVLLLVSAAVATLWWTLRTERGSAWLLSALPGVSAVGPQGALLADFEVQRLVLALPGSADRITLQNAGWRGLDLSRGGPGQWLHIVMADLHAGRVDVVLAPSANTTPLTPPADLRLPVELELRSVHIGELHAAALGDAPLRALQMSLHLGANGGAEHRIDGLSLAWDKLRASGSAQVATDATMALSAKVDLGPDLAVAAPAVDAAAAWQASATLAGPLAAPVLLASVQALPATVSQPSAPSSSSQPPSLAKPSSTPAPPARAAQSLAARATLRPFAPWPLGDLQATARGLDLSAFSSAAPATALNLDALATSHGLGEPAAVSLKLANTEPGPWNEGRLPLRALQLELQGRADAGATLNLQSFAAELGTAKQSAGRVTGQGQWRDDGWTLTATLASLHAALLDARAPAMQLSGPITLAGRGFSAQQTGQAAAAPAGKPASASAGTTPAPPPYAGHIDVKAHLTGTMTDAGPARAVRLTLDAGLNALEIDLRQSLLQVGAAQASLSGHAERHAGDAVWQTHGRAALTDFDPSPWWPGPAGSAWRQGPHRLNAQGDFKLVVPVDAAERPVAEVLGALRGQAELHLANSVLAGVPLSADATWRGGGNGTPATATLALDADGNRLRADGSLAGSKAAARDEWTLTIDAPALTRIAPLFRLLQPAGADTGLAGALSASARVTGRWPDLGTEGRLDATALRAGGWSAQRAQGRWRLGSSAAAAAEADFSITEAGPRADGGGGADPKRTGPLIESAHLQLQGTGRAHRLTLQAASRLLPPAWADELQTAPGAASSRTEAVLRVQGGVIESAVKGEAGIVGWQGTVQDLSLRGNAEGARPLLQTRAVGLALQWAGGPARASLQPGRAELLGGALTWSRMAWQAADGPGAPAQIDAEADLAPLQVAPLLARLQPDFGWGGDLALAGHLKLHSAPGFSADVVIERSRGDLTVTDELGTQSLGLSDLRLALNASEGTWNFTQALAGRTVGVAAGAVVARTTPEAVWPAADTPIEGVLELEVAELGTWGTWVPPGWRIAGALRTSASIAGRFGAPEYTGEVLGSGLSVRNFLQGVNVSEGDVDIKLQGSTARIERFTAKAGTGTLSLAGNASLGEAPSAQLKLTAEKFQLLGRIDRRIVASGSALLRLDKDTVALDGRFDVDEGLIDFTRSDAPALADDVQVLHAKPPDAAASASAAALAAPAPAAAASTPAGSAASMPAVTPVHAREVALNLKVGLGQRLRVRGRGLDTGLRGELLITSPSGKLAVNGTVSTADGTYAAYGQKLSIDRGEIIFTGSTDTPRLDIEATRPNIDTRVGVAVTGTAANLRVRLFSEPELSDIDKLSWLVMGRASDGLGRTDTALLQRAALALLAGDGTGPTEQLTKAIGLDEVSVRQSEGEVRDTVISLGKQLSRRWYVGYERGLNATTGSFQLIYRIAQRFTLRAQSGAENSLDLIWTWRWH